MIFSYFLLTYPFMKYIKPSIYFFYKMYNIYLLRLVILPTPVQTLHYVWVAGSVHYNIYKKLIWKGLEMSAFAICGLRPLCLRILIYNDKKILFRKTSRILLDKYHVIHYWRNGPYYNSTLWWEIQQSDGKLAFGI